MFYLINVNFIMFGSILMYSVIRFVFHTAYSLISFISFFLYCLSVKLLPNNVH